MFYQSYYTLGAEDDTLIIDPPMSYNASLGEVVEFCCIPVDEEAIGVTFLVTGADRSTYNSINLKMCQYSQLKPLKRMTVLKCYALLTLKMTHIEVNQLFSECKVRAAMLP